jgi:hypothetical protein
VKTIGHRTQSVIAAKTHIHGHAIATSKSTVQITRGTGKSQPTAPTHSHKLGGAVMSPRKAKSSFDNRGPSNRRGHR